jgi:ribosomal small subunit protein bTHX
MGKGDKKSKKGKIVLGSYGNSRRKKAIKARLKRSAALKVATPASTEPKAKRTNRKKAEA